MAQIIKQFCLDACSMSRCWNPVCYSGATQDYCACGGCWGRSSSSSFRSPGAFDPLSPSTISHSCLCQQQSPCPWQTGLGRCVITLVTLTSQRSLLCCSSSCPYDPCCSCSALSSWLQKMLSTWHLKPPAQMFGYWPVQSVLLVLLVLCPQPRVAVPSLGMSQSGSQLTVRLFSMFLLLVACFCCSNTYGMNTGISIQGVWSPELTCGWTQRAVLRMSCISFFWIDVRVCLGIKRSLLDNAYLLVTLSYFPVL